MNRSSGPNKPKSKKLPTLYPCAWLIVLLFACVVPDDGLIILDQPNILLLVADDLGYADLGCYGGDIETPHIDQLAAQGIRFSRFHTSPLCAPTRAMLLTGNDNHTAGMGIQSRDDNGFGYEGRLSDRVVTMPELLRENGYHTYMTGKWHLGNDSLSIPVSKGFDRSFVNIGGAGNHYDDQGLFKGNPITTYYEDDHPAQWENGDYSTDFYTDKLIEYIDLNIEDENPFFAFAAFTSPHWPLQVEEKFWKKYEGRYDDGYEELKERRLESLKTAGMISEDAVLPPNHENVKPWDSLTIEEQKMESRKMELYAGMVDNLDYNIGRIVKYLKSINQYENTIIVFMSDNGAAAEDFFHHPEYGQYIQEHFNEDFENMGEPRSFISYGPQWAEAGSSPFRHYKGLTTQGGIVAPMILAGAGITRKNEINHQFLTLMDLAPTFYEAAGADYPKIWNTNEVYSLRGTSLWPFLLKKSEVIHHPDYVFGLEHDNYAMIRKGEWKITNIERPFMEENFALFHVTEDIAELHDLKDIHPDKFQELLEEWKNFSSEVKVQIPAPAW